MITFEGKNFSDKKQALNALAFCHYPVVVVVGDKEKTFHSFDAVKEWLDSLSAEN